MKSQQSTNKDETTQVDLKSRLKDSLPSFWSFWKGKTGQKSSRGKIDGVLKIGERVVTFIEDYPARGTVRYIGDEKDLRAKNIVGLEMVIVFVHIFVTKCKRNNSEE